MNKNGKKVFHVHLVSDATGETINNLARACLVQFDHVEIEEHYWSLIRNKRQLDLVVEGIRQWPGLVLYTFIDETMRKALNDQCWRLGVTAYAVLEPILSVMSAQFGSPSTHNPGKQHVLDADYFARIDAMDYAMSLDDGNQMDKLNEADVVIVGVSRTSKTPTCIYLSHRGIRAANVPFVPESPVDIAMLKLEKPLVVGLTKDPESLVETRKSRVRFLQDADKMNYIDLETVRQEVLEARRLFARLGCPVIDVTRRSIEETAAEIMMLLNKRNMEKEIAKMAADHKEQGS